MASVIDQMNWGDLVSVCACGHKKNHHHYIRLVGDNTGMCLYRECECSIYEEDQ